MKTNFQRKNRRYGKYIVVALLVIGFFLSGAIKPIASSLSIPVIYIKQLLKVYPSDQELLEENRILRERVDKLQLEISTSNNSKADLNEEYLESEVLVRPPQNIYGSLIIRVGDGVNPGDRVLSKNGVYLGVIEEVSLSRAKVELISHPGFQGQFVIERSGLPINTQGVGGGNMRAELPQGSDIEEYDLVVDLETGRVVAEVGSIDADDASAFMKIYMRTPVNIFEITEVLISEK